MRIPDNVTLVYWDYYHHEQKVYDKNIRLHRKLTDKLLFAGGGWTWNGIAPNYRKARATLNVIHRPEMVPEYAEKVTGHGKEEDISRSSLLTESLDIFKTQQEIAHKNGLKTTIQMTYASLFNA